jgi:glutamine phosphoribosylpyrophosphate amidotransferase
MCGIFASRNKDKFIELAKLNQYRGNSKYSITIFDKELTPKVRLEGDGLFNENKIPSLRENEEYFYVGHVQAPTSGSSKVHPNQIGRSLLWHNGILKDEYMETVKEDWDTDHIHNSMLESFENVNNFDGSFACIMYDNYKLYLFRNMLSPLFVDGNHNISSTKFKDSVKLDANVLFNIFGEEGFGDMIVINTFETKNNPYFGL